MSVASNAPAPTYVMAWVALGLVFAYYVVVAAALRWRPQRNIRVTRYEPPPGTSPAVAAYLIGSGRCERAFAAALVSLAAKGYLKIREEKDWFVLEKLRDPDASLPTEESIILVTVFPADLRTYAFSGREYEHLCEAYRGFEELVKGAVEPELLSAHLGVWLVGVALSLVMIVPVIASIPISENRQSPAAIAYLGIWILIGGSCLVAALRAWPATLGKVISFLPGVNRPSHPLSANDLIPLVLTASALFGFAFLAFLTSPTFALFITALVSLNVVARHFLEAPTRAGRKLLAALECFREFLSRADADRLNRDNRPGWTPEILEKYSAYALALDVERGWGEEFTEDLLELLQMDQAYGRRPPKFLSRDRDFIQLKIGPRK